MLLTSQGLHTGVLGNYKNKRPHLWGAVVRAAFASHGCGGFDQNRGAVSDASSQYGLAYIVATICSAYPEGGHLLKRA